MSVPNDDPMHLHRAGQHEEPFTNPFKAIVVAIALFVMFTLSLVLR